jgi:steroid delta-isomerase-like uncharacterized protein
MDTKDLLQRVAQLWNGGDPRGANEFYADDCTYRSTAMTEPLKGRSALVEYIGRIRKAFPDLRLTVDEVLTEPDRAAVRWTWTGTHKGEWGGVAPTGRKVTQTGLSLMRMRSGKIIDEFVAADRYSVMSQIGALPARPSSAGAGH